MQAQYTQLDYEKSLHVLEQAKRDIETPSLELAYQCRLASKRIKRCKASKRLVKQLEVMD